MHDIAGVADGALTCVTGGNFDNDGFAAVATEFHATSILQAGFDPIREGHSCVSCYYLGLVSRGGNGAAV